MSHSRIWSCVYVLLMISKQCLLITVIKVIALSFQGRRFPENSTASSLTKSRKSFSHQKSVPPHQAAAGTAPDDAVLGEAGQHKGCIVRSPLPCWGSLAPLRARVQRLRTEPRKGQAAIHTPPWFLSLPGVREPMLWKQVLRIRSLPRLSAPF